MLESVLTYRIFGLHVNFNSVTIPDILQLFLDSGLRGDFSQQNLSEKALSDAQEVYIRFFAVFKSLWCNDKSVDVHHLPLDIPKTEGSLHALF